MPNAQPTGVTPTLPIPDPKSSWVSLARAPFLYRMKEGPNGTYEAGTPLLEIENLLKRLSMTTEVEIDLARGTLRLRSDDTASGKLHPWLFISPKPRDPGLSALLYGEEQPFDPTLEPDPDRLDRAIAQVWHHIFVTEFNNAVAAGHVLLWGRLGSGANFSRLYADVWASCRTIDWARGVAQTADSLTLVSIYAEEAGRPTDGGESVSREAVQPDPSDRQSQGKRRRSSPSKSRAEKAIRDLYPAGVPDQTTLPNWLLTTEICNALAKAGLPSVGEDTILRAADRRK